MKAETKRPKNKATTTNDVKSGQNGNANKQTPLRIRDIFVTTSEDTHGRSTKVETIWFHKDIPEAGPRQLKILILSFYNLHNFQQITITALTNILRDFCHTLGQSR